MQGGGEKREKKQQRKPTEDYLGWGGGIPFILWDKAKHYKPHRLQ